MSRVSKLEVDLVEAGRRLVEKEQEKEEARLQVEKLRISNLEAVEKLKQDLEMKIR